MLKKSFKNDDRTETTVIDNARAPALVFRRHPRALLPQLNERVLPALLQFLSSLSAARRLCVVFSLCTLNGSP
jgi:hypothetical protein